MIKSAPFLFPQRGKAPWNPLCFSPLLRRGRGRLYYSFKKAENLLFGLLLVALFAGKKVLPDQGSRKEVFQPHLPVRLPCYDLTPVIGFTLGRSSRSHTSGTPNSHGLTGGVYKARERIHRAMADARLLAIPASRSRVADSDPN